MWSPPCWTNSIPLTTNEYDEWGNPNEREDYGYMLSYSPYDNVRAQGYPAMFVTTGLWDSQVQYYEPAKWIAKLRALKTDPTPVFLHVDMEAGHGGKSGRFPTVSRESRWNMPSCWAKQEFTGKKSAASGEARSRRQDRLRRGEKTRLYAGGSSVTS